MFSMSYSKVSIFLYSILYTVNCHGNGSVLYVSGMKLTIIYDQII